MRETEDQKKQRRAHNSRLIQGLIMPSKQPPLPPPPPPPSQSAAVSWASIMEKMTLDHRDRITQLEIRIVILGAVSAVALILTFACLLGR